MFQRKWNKACVHPFVLKLKKTPAKQYNYNCDHVEVLHNETMVQCRWEQCLLYILQSLYTIRTSQNWLTLKKKISLHVRRDYYLEKLLFVAWRHLILFNVISEIYDNIMIH